MIGENWKFDHNGLIVRDMQATWDHYARLGFERVKGPLETAPRSAENPRTSKVVWLRKDTLILEIIQPLEGKWVNMNFLHEVGDGISHLGFTVSDLAAERERMEAAGFPVVHSSESVRAKTAFFDTRACGNLMIELLQPVGE